MREYSAPLNVEIPSTGNVTDDVVTNALEAPEAVVFSRRSVIDGVEGWGEVTASAFLAEVRAVAKGLVAAGIQVGERVALVSKTRYEWTLVDYAIWFAGAVTVPVYETSSAEQIEWILSDSGARAVFAETPEHASRLKGVRDRLTGLHHTGCHGMAQHIGLLQGHHLGEPVHRSLGGAVDRPALVAGPARS